MRRAISLRHCFHRFPPFRSFVMTPTPSPLSIFLAINRSRYLDALTMDKSRDWTVVVGNEAGDLDSAASSIAYSYLASTLLNRPTIAILQTPRTDLQLRAENLYAYEIARLDSHQTDLLCIDDIPAEFLPRLSSSSFALVDHNRLASRFSEAQSLNPPRVAAIIDHHEDEGAHRDAETRLITIPVGSCASLVTKHFMGFWGKAEPSPPPELASLLLCAIFIDTRGLKPGGKAVSLDHTAVDFLLPQSTFPPSSPRFSTIERNREGMETLIETLDERKRSVAHLSTRDLLRRDYKEYTFDSSSYSLARISIGIATVPLSPKKWFHREASPKFWESMDAWIDERGLDALGVLCTYNSPKNGEHKRQNFWVVKCGRESLRKALWEGMEQCEELKLERRNMKKKVLSEGMDREPDGDVRTVSGSVARIWKQRNTKATRKVIAPLVKNIVIGQDALS